MSETHQPRPPFSSDTTERFKKNVDDAARRLEHETENFIRYINDEVVPEVRKHSSRGLRTASQKLRDFADYLDKHGK